MKPSECSAETRKGRDYYNTLAARGEIEHVRVGRAVFIPRRALTAYLQRNTFPVSA